MCRDLKDQLGSSIKQNKVRPIKLYKQLFPSDLKAEKIWSQYTASSLLTSKESYVIFESQEFGMVPDTLGFPINVL